MVDTNYIVKSIRPITYIQYFQFTADEGKTQLDSILECGKNYFRISTAPHKIRFVNADFRAQIDTILHEAENIQRRKLCDYLVEQIRSGHVILETKDSDGKIHAITSTGLTNGSSTKKQYAQVELASKGYFEEIADGFEKNLDELLESLKEYNAKELKGPTLAQADRKKQDAVSYIRVTNTPRLQKSIARQVTGLVASICKAIPKTIEKMLKLMAEDAREEARRSKAEFDRIEKKKHHEKADLLKLEVRKHEIAQKG